MIQTDTYTRQVAEELTSSSTKQVLALTLLVLGAIVVVAGIATASAIATATGGFIALAGAAYTAVSALTKRIGA